MNALRATADDKQSVRAAVWGGVVLALSTVLALGIVGVLRDNPTETGTSELTRGEQPLDLPINLVQANISKDQSYAKFTSDVAAVYEQNPDIITFNEVYRRSDADLTRKGYSIFRTPGIRKGWAPVVWRDDKWTMTDSGTVKISDTAEGQRGLVGVRYANWVTLVNPDGLTVSVIAAHIAPNSGATASLLVPSLKKLNKTALALRESGPVILAGDFNMGYYSDRYQPQYLAGAGLKSTFDMMGRSFPTHRRGGAIDYVFLSPVDNFYLEDTYPVLMKSDHRMVVAKLHLLGAAQGDPPPTFDAGTVSSDPRGSKERQRAVRTLERRAIAATPGGAAIHLASDRIWGRRFIEELVAAHERGVNVTVITDRRDLSDAERALRKLLGHDSTQPRYFVKKRNLWPDSSRAPRRAVGGKLQPTMLLISRAGGTPAFGLTANTNLGRKPLQRRYGSPTLAKVTTDLASYDKRYRKYLAAIGRSY